MKKHKSLGKKILSVVVASVVMTIGIPGLTMAAEIPTYHDIPAYQQKNLYETSTVKVSGITVEEVVNATVSPVITKSITKSIKFVVFNSTTQQVEHTVYSEDGELPEMELKKNHNYIIFAEDSQYRMQNAYIWIKEGIPVDIKKGAAGYDYPEVKSLHLYKRDVEVSKPEDERRVLTNLPVLYGTGTMYNIKFKLVSDVETIEATSGSEGKLRANLLEDIIYMVTVDNDTYDVASFPITVKDKSEYGAGKYTYNHSSCARVDNIHLVKKADAHKEDTIVTSISGKTEITGLNFRDYLVMEQGLEKNLVTELSGKDYDVMNISVINPHRWEIAKLATGVFKVTESIADNKKVANVYYLDKDNKLQKMDFTQDGAKVTFSMNTLSMYPVVIEYGNGESVPAVDKTRLNVKVVDEKGSPVSGLGLCFKSTNYGEHADIDFDAVTDAEGKVSYECSDNEFNDDVYELVLKDTSKYTCDEIKQVVFGMENWKTFISTIDDEEYTGEEIVLTVKSVGGSEPEEPEVDKAKLNVKVVDEKGGPVSGLGLCFKSTNYGEYADIDFDAVTDAEGKVSYECSDNEFNDDVYELVLKDTSKYTCDEIKQVVFGMENWKTFISTIDDEEYTGEEIVLTVKSVGGSEPEEPEVDKAKLNVKVVDEKGGPVSGLGLCFKSTNYGEYADIDFDAVTDAEGKVSYECSDNEFNDDVYELVLKDTSKYTCDEIKQVVFGMENWKTFISTIDDEEYTGEEIVLTVKSVGGSEPEEPEPEPEINTVISSITQSTEKGSTATITVQGKDLPETMYYIVNYKKMGQYAEEEYSAGTYKEIKTTGNETERTFEVKLPALSEYPGALSWRVGVNTLKDDGYYFTENIVIKKDSSVDDNKDSENPDKPNKPGNGHNFSDKAGSRSVKTGDTANVLPFIGGMTVAAFVILVLLKKKRTVK